MKAPLFLICSERSGSNLIRVIAGSHSHICAPAPPHLLKTFFPLIHAYGNLHDEANFLQLAEDIVANLQVQSGEWTTNPAGSVLVARAQATTFAGLLDAVYALEAKALGKKRYFIKDNGVVHWIFQILTAFPDAKFVYLVRDPRDAALSWLKSDIHPGGVAHATKIWMAEQRKALQAYALLKDSGQIHLIHYEDLVSDPETKIRQLCAFIEEEFEESMLAFNQTDEAKVSAKGSTGWTNLTKPMMKSNFGKFRGQMSAGRIRTIESIARQEMQMLGYPLDFAPKKKRGIALHDLPKVVNVLRTYAGMVFSKRSGKQGAEKYRERIRQLRKIQQDRGSRSPKTWEVPGFAQESNEPPPPSEQASTE